ncbi:MAG TPA: phosphate regulon transcriptional regulatory protein PhoB, partial [Gammaproteobacteria bacterium]|nr:phosphate regulon transcriptional regulatory protein PhoB [Gammaproteobacteria bacterium]
ARILFVDDEAAIRELVDTALSRAGFEVELAADVMDAESRLVAKMPDLVLLDWMLPGVSGVEYARRLRRDDRARDLPIILLTARGEEADKVRGLDSGADDYITKPFSPRELVARINAVLRRAAPHMADEIIEVDGLCLDAASHRVTARGDVLEMGPTEYRLLHFFMTHPERVYSRGQLLDRVWGGNVYVEERTVDVHIRRLRKALSPHGHERYIQTVRGAGYRFSQQV